MLSYPEVQLFIGGKWRSTADSSPILNPADDTEIGRVPHATRQDLADAVEAAEHGFEIWRNTSPERRCQIMMGASQLLKDRSDQIATVMTLEQGKPLAQSKAEIERACDIIEWDAQEGRRLYGRQIPGVPGMMHTVIREPIGIVAAFSPWNFPVSSPVRKVAGALASGCSIILKAAEETPASAAMTVQAFADAGLPDGVLNLVFGVPHEISEYLIAQPAVRLVTFTGSVPVGKKLASLAGEHMKPAIMELGGHCPAIICEDVDVDEIASMSAIVKSRNAGQVCVAPTRFYVHDKIYDRFVEEMARHASAMHMGSGLNAETELGPLANRRRLDAIRQLVEDAVARGARVASGGARNESRGYFYPMTVLADLSEDARCLSEEPFGPLALICRYGCLGDAIKRANGLPFGLAAYGFSHDADKVAAMVAGLECGNLSINHYVASLAETPFGGVKDSGYGREGGTEGLLCYTVAKNVSHRTRLAPAIA